MDRGHSICGGQFVCLTIYSWADTRVRPYTDPDSIHVPDSWRFGVWDASHRFIALRNASVNTAAHNISHTNWISARSADRREDSPAGYSSGSSLPRQSHG